MTQKQSDWDLELSKLDGKSLKENLLGAFGATSSAMRVATPILDVLLSPRREDSRSRLDKEFEEREKISNRYYYNKDYYD
ncbi:hypothetical protein LF929_015970 [Dickeya oryzae]|uniref:Uncharacterized protein n=1 Tax=Dickeya oryzae TaxID=1240404 RepID=A0AB39IIZ0_9GAMM|nr:hypothetical protein [Dickeya oryzae]MCA6990790.1 hypothetical protein [Dickeya oryzae]